MRALRFDRYGDPSVLQVQDMPTPVLGQDEVSVKVHAAGINPSDVKNVQGLMPHTKLPRTPGRDFAGIVAQGPADLVGQEVWGSGGDLGFGRNGTHADSVALPREGVCPKPTIISFEEAAAVGVPFVTAWTALIDAGQLISGETVGVTGAAGSVGSAAVQIARWRGARVISIVRDESQREVVLGMGAELVIALQQEDLREAILGVTNGKGANLIFDTVGTSLFEPSLSALANRGRLMEITVSGERRVSFDLLDFYRRELRLLGVNTLSLDVTATARILELLTPGFESGALHAPRIAATFPLEQATQAYERVAKGVPGKVVLVM